MCTNLLLEAGPDARKVDNVLLLVGALGLSVLVDNGGAIWIKYVEADRVELHHLARKVLIRRGARACERAAPVVGQRHGRNRAEEHLSEHIAQVSKRVSHENVGVVQVLFCLVGEADRLFEGGDVDLLQRPRSALAQLIVCEEGDVGGDGVLSARLVVPLPQVVLTLLVLVKVLHVHVVERRDGRHFAWRATRLCAGGDVHGRVEVLGRGLVLHATRQLGKVDRVA
eukprot:5499180-Pleurochrysis_carterae.AAC.2